MFAPLKLLPAVLCLSVVACTADPPAEPDVVPQPRAALPAPLTTPLPPREAYIDVIAERSLFDSRHVGGRAEAGALTEPGAETDLPLVLLGTVIAEPSRFSSALIAQVDDKGRPGISRGYGIGDEVMDGVRIEAISPREIRLSRDGRTERLTISDGIDRSRAVPREELRSAVQRQGRSYVLDEDTFSVATADSVTDGVRMASASDGVRISRAARSTVLYKMGLRRRDVIREINGQKVDSPDALKGALRDAMEDERQFSISLQRRKRDRTLRYTLR